MPSPSPFPMPVLNVQLPAIQDVKGGEGLSSLWTVFSKCKDSIEEGGRLENISWRLWYRHLHPPNHHHSSSPYDSDDDDDHSQRISLAVPSSPVETASSCSHSDVSSYHSNISERSSSPPGSPHPEPPSPSAAAAASSSSSRPLLDRSSSSDRNLGSRANFMMSIAAPSTEAAKTPSTSGQATPRPALGLRSNSTPRIPASSRSQHHHNTHSTQSSPRGGTHSHHHNHHNRSRHAISAHTSSHDLSSNNMMSFGRVLGEVFREGMTTTGGREMLIQRERERSQLSQRDRSSSRKSVERYRPSSAASSDGSFASAIEAYAEAQQAAHDRDRAVAVRGREGLRKPFRGEEREQLVIQFIGPTPANTEPNTPAGSGKQTPVGTLSPLHTYTRPTFHHHRRSEPDESLVKDSASPFEEAQSFSDSTDSSLGITTSASPSNSTNTLSGYSRSTHSKVQSSAPSSNDPPSSDSASTAREINDPASDTVAGGGGGGKPKMFFIQSPNDNSESSSFGGSDVSSMGADDRGIGFGRDDGTSVHLSEQLDGEQGDLDRGEDERKGAPLLRERRSSGSSTGAASSSSAPYAPTSSSPLKLVTLPSDSPIPSPAPQRAELVETARPLPSSMPPSLPPSPETARPSPIATAVPSPPSAAPPPSRPTLPNEKPASVASAAPKQRRKSSSAATVTKPFALTSIAPPKRAQPSTASSTSKGKRRASASHLMGPGFLKGLGQAKKTEHKLGSDDEYEEIGSAEDEEDDWSEEASLVAPVTSMVKPREAESAQIEEVVLQDGNESGEWASDDNPSPSTTTTTPYVPPPPPRPKAKSKKSFTIGNGPAHPPPTTTAVHANQPLAPPKLASKRQVSAQTQKRLLAAQAQRAREEEAERQRTMFQKISPSKSAADLYGLGREVASAPVSRQGSSEGINAKAAGAGAGLGGARVGSGLLSSMFRSEREKREQAMMPPPPPPPSAPASPPQPKPVEKTLGKQRSHSSSQDLWQHHRNVIGMTSSTKSSTTTGDSSSNSVLLPRTKSSAALPLESGFVVGRAGLEGGEAVERTEPSEQAVSPVKSIFSGNGHGPAGEASEAQKRLSTLSKKASLSNIRHGFSALLPLSTTVISPSASSVSSSGAHSRTTTDASSEPLAQAEPEQPPAVVAASSPPPPPSAPSVPALAHLPTRHDSPLSPPPFAAPQSPRTTRRAMLAAELPEELRKQLLWERMSRQKILGPGAARTSNNASTASTAAGAANGNGTNGGGGKLARSTSTPKLDGEREGRGESSRPNIGTRSSTSSGETTPQPAQSTSATPTGPATANSNTTTTNPPAPVAPLAKRGTILGGTLLRPLTSVMASPSPPPRPTSTTGSPSTPGSPLQRSKSTSSRLPPRRNKRSSTAGSTTSGATIGRRFDPRTGEDLDSSDEEREAEMAREKREGEEEGGKLKRRNTHHGNISSMYYADEGWDADYHSRGF